MCFSKAFSVQVSEGIWICGADLLNKSVVPKSGDQSSSDGSLVQLECNRGCYNSCRSRRDVLRHIMQRSGKNHGLPQVHPQRPGCNIRCGVCVLLANS